MHGDFKDVLNKISNRTHSEEWTTDTGYVLQGVLSTRKNRVLLSVSTKGLSESIEFNYLFKLNEIGNRRLLYPFESKNTNRIHPAPLTGSTYIEIFLVVDEYSVPAGIPFDENVTFLYDSFLWIDVPETKEDEARLEPILKKIQEIETRIGKFSVNFPITTSSSRYPGKFEKKCHPPVIMDTLSLSR